MAGDESSHAPDERQRIVRRHMRLGWWGVFLFMCLGLALETMHGLKLPFYLDVRNEVRRTLWTLAHVHGTLLSLLNVAFALCLARTTQFASLKFTSAALVLGTLLMPTGFFLGGFGHRGGDPGLGVLLAPAGAVFLLAAIATAARQFSRGAASPPAEPRSRGRKRQGK